jgi:hypothetical protein
MRTKLGAPSLRSKDGKAMIYDLTENNNQSFTPMPVSASLAFPSSNGRYTHGFQISGL